MQKSSVFCFGVQFGSARHASIAVSALSPDLQARQKGRSKVAMRGNKNILLFHVSAADGSALKAEASSLQRLAALVKDILEGGC